MAVLVPKRTVEHPDVGFGICVWQLPDGTLIKDDDGNYLAAQGRVGNRRLEYKMAREAENLGYKGGKPVWWPGFRKITESEWCDQMEALMEGKIPDPVDAYLQSEGRA